MILFQQYLVKKMLKIYKKMIDLYKKSNIWLNKNISELSKDFIKLDLLKTPMT